MNIKHVCQLLFLTAGVSACSGLDTFNNNRHNTSPDTNIETRSFNATYLSVAEIRQQGLTSVDLTQQSIDLINQLDRSGPSLNSVVEINPEALTIARNLDQGPSKGPLHGIPVLLKDNIDTGDKMQTTAGSLALVGQPATNDALIVQQLRSAGAVILGKTNLSEWANFRSRKFISGWSARGGQTKNPHVLDRSPCGSSSGSAVAVAAGLVTLAVGTETDGSILCPSAMNGIVGIKPSRGLVSQHGIVPLSHSQDTAGPMARTVTDAAMLLQVLASSSADSIRPQTTQKQDSNYSVHLNSQFLRGKRIGVLVDRRGLHPATDELFLQALESFTAAGAELVQDLKLAQLSEVYAPEYQVLLYDFKHDINNYLKSRAGIAVGNLAEIIAFNETHATQEMPYFGQDILIEAQQKGGLNTPEYSQALEKSRYYAGAAGIEALLEEHQLDALVAPAYPPAYLIDPVFGDNFMFGNSTAAAVAGNPSITVPAGFDHNLPVGIVLIGHHQQDAKLIGMAYAFEQQHQAWRPPKFLPSVSN